jgi:hypothetical protein
LTPIPLLKIDKDEEIIFALVSSYISGTGYYKLLAKQKVDNTFEWVHFTERVNGDKENIYRGTVESKEKLDLLLEIMNRNLTKTFGSRGEMKQGEFKVSTLPDASKDKTIN